MYQPFFFERALTAGQVVGAPLRCGCSRKCQVTADRRAARQAKASAEAASGAEEICGSSSGHGSIDRGLKRKRRGSPIGKPATRRSGVLARAPLEKNHTFLWAKVHISASARPDFFFHGKTKVVELAEISIMAPRGPSFGASIGAGPQVPFRPSGPPTHVVLSRP